MFQQDFPNGGTLDAPAFRKFRRPAYSHKLAIAIAVFIAGMAVTSARAADIATRSLAAYRNEVMANLPLLRSEIRRGLTPAQAEIEKSIIYLVPVNGELNAFASMTKDRQRVIELNAGLVQYADWLSTMGHILVVDSGSQECMESYFSFLIDGIGNDRFVPQKPDLPTPVDGNPFQFMRTHPSICPTPEIVASRLDYLNKNASVDAMLRWVIGHELAHHLLGHVNNPLPKQKSSRDLDISRTRELAADKFSLRLFSASGEAYQILAVIGMPTMFAGLENFTLDREPLSDHPAGARRMALFLDAWQDLAADTQFRAMLRRAGILDSFLAHLSQMAGDIKERGAEHESWFISMTTSVGQTSKDTYLILTALPSDHIRPYLQAGYSIISVAESAGRWVVMLRKAQYGQQVYIVDDQFPYEYVRAHWDAGFEITTLASDGHWFVVVMSKGSGIDSQQLYTGAVLPADGIQRAWADGKYITGLTKVGSQYWVLMSETPAFSNQVYQCSDYAFPANFVREKWDERYFLTSTLPLEHGGWCAVMSKTQQYRDQAYWVMERFPDHEMNEKERNGFRVLSLY